MLARCRISLAVLYSPEWAQEFTAAYRAGTGRRTNLGGTSTRYKYRRDWHRFIPSKWPTVTRSDTKG
jgi:hypothetical protein